MDGGPLPSSDFHAFPTTTNRELQVATPIYTEQQSKSSFEQVLISSPQPEVSDCHRLGMRVRGFHASCFVSCFSCLMCLKRPNVGTRHNITYAFPHPPTPSSSHPLRGAFVGPVLPDPMDTDEEGWSLSPEWITSCQQSDRNPAPHHLRPSATSSNTRGIVGQRNIQPGPQPPPTVLRTGKAMSHSSGRGRQTKSNSIRLPRE
ncbi:uncharacterized protein LY79DRAFT_5582 [Colletotrichum navitas]|uniref:Uncharacterized protein n=1 Tax=Colletotrichum navitas TaxID=681940 RepID=A0AAD8QCI9_9PEZI|nr:uncharacterized protein LY79DRAFT_5582 [Colletotrichum navitas]KAK1600067.1 hypothetical protein LY79DRAFT_5582 [Colletotrichum navitas]